MLEIITDNTMKQVVCRDGGPHGGSHHQDPWHKRNSGEESRAANIKLRLVQLFVTVLILKVRSGMLRAVAKLVVITDVRDTNLEMAEKHFDVYSLPDINDMEESD